MGYFLFFGTEYENFRVSPRKILLRMASTDKELVEATLGGENQAFAVIIERYQRLVFSIICHYVGNRDEVEDLA